MAIRHVNCHVPKRSTSSGQRTALYQFPGRSTSQENVSRTLSSFAGFSVSTSEVTSSWEAIRRGKSIHSCSFFSPLFSTKEISKMRRRKRTSTRKTYSKFYGVHRWREKFKVEEDRYRGIDSHFSWIGKRRLQNGWMLFIYSCRNRRFILRLDKKIKNLILIIFRSLRFLFSVLSVFCGQICMIYDSP